MEQLQTALKTDYVLTSTQVQRYYGLTDLEHPKLRIFSHYVAATRNSHNHRQVDFVALKSNQKASKERAAVLRHYAGIADMRQQLKAPVEQWRLVTKMVGGEEPDAFWYKNTRAEASHKDTVAIEFDAGSYNPKQLKQKLISFAVYQKQVWGSSSKKRVERIEKLARELDVNNFEVLYVSWL